MIYAVGPDQTLLVIGLDNVERMLNGFPVASIDKQVILAVVRDIDRFSAGLDDLNMDAMTVDEGFKRLSDLHKQCFECEQVDSQSYIQEHIARASMLLCGTRRVAFMELRLLDEMISGAPFGGAELGFTVLVSKNLPYIRRKLNDSHRKTSELVKLVMESNMQAHEPIDVVEGETEIHVFDTRPIKPVDPDSFAGPGAENN